MNKWICDDLFIDALEAEGKGIIDHLETVIPDTSIIFSVAGKEEIDYVCIDLQEGE